MGDAVREWIFLAESIYLLGFPAVRPTAAAAPKRLRDYFGWEALALFKERDHRMIFLTTAFFSMPLAAFYPYIGKHLDALHASFPGARLALAQAAEVVGMLGFASLMTRFRLKWLIVGALVCGLLRYACFAPNVLWLIMVGIALHGVIFILFSMTTQIYLEQRVPHALRNQAQALLMFMTSGIGNLVGYSAGGLWYRQCEINGAEDWPRFWSVLAASIVPVLIFFLLGYRGRPRETVLSASL